MLNRIKNILLQPASEWSVISNEPASVKSIFSGYAIPLSALQFVATVVAMGVLGIGAELMELGGISVSLADTVLRGVISFAMSLVLLYVLALVCSKIAPSFNGNSDLVQALKLFTYSSTPTWVLGAIMPFLMGSMGLMMLVSLLSLAALGYAIYLIYIGAGPTLGIPQEKLAGFTVVIIAIYIGLAVIVYGITSATQKLSLF